MHEKVRRHRERALYCKINGVRGNGIMTKEAFLNLDYGNIVVYKRFPGEVYEIDNTEKEISRINNPANLLESIRAITARHVLSFYSAEP